MCYEPFCLSDINSQVTIITKTFLRYKELNVLIQSIRKFYPNIKIIVADDSLNPEPVSGNNIEHYIMPPAQSSSLWSWQADGCFLLKAFLVGHQKHQAQETYDSYRNQGKLERRAKTGSPFFKNYLNYIKYD
ncbi:hypothetical protein cypCar_00039110 [Cyprinus carpio]|nr:hypothetical protein cypCar_00039110 [Cyprinus carpio]